MNFFFIQVVRYLESSMLNSKCNLVYIIKEKMPDTDNRWERKLNFKIKNSKFKF